MDVQNVLILIVAAIFVTGGQAAKVTFTNNCPFTVWPGTLTGGGVPQLPITGLVLLPHRSDSIEVPPNWSSGRFWGRTGCSIDATGKLKCLTGDCASGEVACNGAGAIPPATLMEFTLNGAGGLDFFDISLVDGFNLPVSITPVGGAGVCNAASCAKSINRVCPRQLAVRNSKGRIVACKSACLAFNKPQYCCSGAYGSPTTCHPSWYAHLFKAQCPQAYSYAYDDKSSTFTCPTGKNYIITFCP
ncbi:Thaumatin-like protein 1a [Linum grandiflorum]